MSDAVEIEPTPGPSVYEDPQDEPHADRGMIIIAWEANMDGSAWDSFANKVGKVRASFVDHNVKVTAVRGDAVGHIEAMLRPRQSNIVAHARRELEILGEDPTTVAGYIRMLEVFAEMGHSGGSASVFIPTLNALLNFQNLKPLTNNPLEWAFIAPELHGDETRDLYQNRRSSEAFSHDGGLTYYLVTDKADGKDVIYTADEWSPEELLPETTI